MTEALKQQGTQPTLDETVRARIRMELARREISQRGLARMMDRDDIWVSRRVSSRASRSVPLSLDDVEEFAAALGLPLVKLLPRLDSNQEPSGMRRELAAVLPFRARPALTLP